MDEATFVVDLVRALAWPATVLLALWWFREPIAVLVDRVEGASVTGAGVSVAFRRRLARLDRRLPAAGAAHAEFAGAGSAAGSPAFAAIAAVWADTKEAFRTAPAPIPDAAIAGAGELAGLFEQARRSPDALAASDAERFAAVAARLRDLAGRP